VSVDAAGSRRWATTFLRGRRRVLVPAADPATVALDRIREG
jgi:hypothetical protein